MTETDEMNKVIDKNILLTAVAQRKTKLLKLLLEGGTDVNYRGYDGKTALMLACCFLQQRDNEDTIYYMTELLLKHGADPNVRDMNGRTAITHAFRYSVCPKIVQLLLRGGADPSITDNKGLSSFCYIKQRHWPIYRTCIREYMSPEFLTELSDQLTQTEIPTIMIDCATPKKTKRSDSFIFPIISHASSNSDIHVQIEASLPTDDSFGLDYVNDDDFSRRHSEGERIEQSLSVYRNMQSAGSHKKELLSIDKIGRLQRNRLRSKSSDDIAAIAKCHNISQFSDSKQMFKSISDVDKTILEQGFTHIRPKLPPIK